MPLRDHFHPPLSDRRRWEPVHSIWPGMLIQRLIQTLPAGYVAEPRVRVGVEFEIDIGALEDDSSEEGVDDHGGIATLTRTATVPAPTWTTVADVGGLDDYSVRVYDEQSGFRLVAAIELVSRRNKDRPAAREAIVAKAVALIRKGVSVSIVDMVTVPQFNLYADVLDLIDVQDPAVGNDPLAIYTATCRGRRTRRRSYLDVWYYPLTVGQPLPPLPVWLNEETALMIDLEGSYEDACRLLRIK